MFTIWLNGDESPVGSIEPGDSVRIVNTIPGVKHECATCKGELVEHRGKRPAFAHAEVTDCLEVQPVEVHFSWVQGVSIHLEDEDGTLRIVVDRVVGEKRVMVLGG